MPKSCPTAAICFALHNPSLKIWLDRKLAVNQSHHGDGIRSNIAKLSPATLLSLLANSDAKLQDSPAVFQQLEGKLGALPWITIARHAGCLEQLGDPENDSLWAEFAQADPAQAALVRAHYAAIKDAVEAASARARAEDPESPLPERLEALVPALWPCLW